MNSSLLATAGGKYHPDKASYTKISRCLTGKMFPKGQSERDLEGTRSLSTLLDSESWCFKAHPPSSPALFTPPPLPPPPSPPCISPPPPPPLFQAPATVRFLAVLGFRASSASVSLRHHRALPHQAATQLCHSHSLVHQQAASACPEPTRHWLLGINKKLGGNFSALWH